MCRVVIIQRVLPHYRVSFFEELYVALKEEGVEFNVIYGGNQPGTVPESVIIDRPWALYIENKYISVGESELVWQPALSAVGKYDLVIVEQAARLLLNYYLMLRKIFFGTKLAFLAHGMNFQSVSSTVLSEMLKKLLVNQADYYFAYTNISKNVLCKAGFNDQKISVVQNTIDERQLKLVANEISSDQLSDIKKTVGINSDNVVLYCGGMYPEKKISFLLESCLRLKNMDSSLEVVFIGSGPDQYMVEDFCACYDWGHYLGAMYGADRVPYFLLSKVLLMPGLVGLAVIDSFIFKVPLFTTDIPIHSPEIDYLESEYNGVMTGHDIDEYVGAISHYLDDQDALSILKSGCDESARKYTIQNMVENFSSGVLRCCDNGSNES